jgi:hypothetical protein
VFLWLGKITHQPVDQARTHSGKQCWCRRDRRYFPHDSGDVETHAPITKHREKVKEDAADREASKGGHSFTQRMRAMVFRFESVTSTHARSLCVAACERHARRLIVL